MLFNSYEYIFLFLPIVFFTYFYFAHKKKYIVSKTVLVIASLFFYSWWNIIYLPLILSSMIINYRIGTLLSNNKVYKLLTKKQLLMMGIVFNVSLLGYFKYSDFFISNINFVFNSSISLLHLALPLAISFFTFQQIAYLVDSYRKETKEYDLLNYGLFVTFFPQLIAGPIVHHKEMMPQFKDENNNKINYTNISLGLFIFAIGLFKKVVLADTFAIWANYGFDTTSTLTFFEAWGSLLSYSFQLYFDFSGYTDMAIGAALLFNIKLPLNFNSPYKSTSIIEMWERWHMTLSRFINTYVFKTILKSFDKYSFSKGMIAVFLSMLISGLWHGASWMFVFFGVIHGTALVINHIWKKKIKIKIPMYLGWFLTFNLWNFALVFFRSESWESAFKMLKGLLGLSGFVVSKDFAQMTNYINPLSQYFHIQGVHYEGGFSIQTLIALGIGFIIILLFKNSNTYLKDFKYSLSNALFIVFVIITFHFMQITYANSIFLYFNF